MNKPHVHAALMLQYAQDAAENGTPWDRWEVCGSDRIWSNLSTNPLWVTEHTYRRKVTTRIIPSFEVPATLKVVEVGQTVYTIDVRMMVECVPAFGFHTERCRLVFGSESDAMAAYSAIRKAISS